METTGAEEIVCKDFSGVLTKGWNEAQSAFMAPVHHRCKLEVGSQAGAIGGAKEQARRLERLQTSDDDHTSKLKHLYIKKAGISVSIALPEEKRCGFNHAKFSYHNS